MSPTLYRGLSIWNLEFMYFQFFQHLRLLLLQAQVITYWSVMAPSLCWLHVHVTWTIYSLKASLLPVTSRCFRYNFCAFCLRSGFSHYLLQFDLHHPCWEGSYVFIDLRDIYMFLFLINHASFLSERLFLFLIDLQKFFCTVNLIDL